MVNFKLEGELALSRLMDLPHISLQAVFWLNCIRNAIHLIDLELGFSLLDIVLILGFLIFLNLRALNREHRNKFFFFKYFGCGFALSVNDIISPRA